MATRFALRLCLCLAALLAIACGSDGAVARPPRLACSPTDHHVRANGGAAAGKTLVPVGAIALTVCSYRGLNPSPKRIGTLLHTRRVASAKRNAGIARELDALPPFPSGEHALACPNDDGSTMVLLFGYRHQSVDPVLVELTGCQTVTNGPVVRWAIPDPKLIGHLQALAR
ncbi:MAG: hypothetical protein DLM64_02150 [Solirubrobacterales bacterium]|nr:MAG: hypothetical protein DLM64_02150 [Solirubrobacterales bacterium]